MTPEQQLEALCRGAQHVEKREELLERLQEGRPLRIKYGADPSAPDLHLGHSVPMKKLRLFQELGHEVTFIVGDFTGRIGDPSGKSKTRPMLSQAQVEQNAATYVQQAAKILDVAKAQIVFNSTFFEHLGAGGILELASTYTVARMLERDDFAKRMAQESPISVRELLYPLIQSYDSVALEADVEIGGQDQLFNVLVARDVQRAYGQRPQVALCFPLLPGLDGVEKMSKSLGNYVGLTDEPNDMFGKLMSIPDDLLPEYYRLLLDTPEPEWRQIAADMAAGGAHPREVKADLAERIVAQYHTPEQAAEAREEFGRIFAQGELPADLPVVAIRSSELEEGKLWLPKLLKTCGLVASTSEGRRMIEQGAVSLDQERCSDAAAEVEVRTGMVLQVGKRRFARVEISE